MRLQPPTDSRRIFISDCEGPISKNDNAFELASRFIPHGDRLFTLISRYDDVLADIVKRQGYKAGDTLKLVLPFLKAYGATNKLISDYSLQNILLVPGARETLQFIPSFMPTFIVSTSYEQYMRALCKNVCFPFENVYCTHLDLDKYGLSEKERITLKRFGEQIAKLSMPDIPKDAQSLDDFPPPLQRTIRKLDEIFWDEISSMDVGTIFREVNPVGGAEKAAAVKEIVSRLSSDIRDVMYVGDSITDVEVFRLVRKQGGLTVSFNGNQYAVREAEVAVLSENTLVNAILADIFNRFGKSHIRNLLEEWSSASIESLGLNELFGKDLARIFKGKLPRVEVVTARNVEQLMAESTAFRKNVRGEAIGKLG